MPVVPPPSSEAADIGPREFTTSSWDSASSSRAAEVSAFPGREDTRLSTESTQSRLRENTQGSSRSGPGPSRESDDVVQAEPEEEDLCKAIALIGSIIQDGASKPRQVRV